MIFIYFNLLCLFAGYLSLLLLKFPDALADQIKDLPVPGPPLVFGNIIELVVKLRIDFDTQMPVILVAHDPAH